jgi:hypothetical protein
MKYVTGQYWLPIHRYICEEPASFGLVLPNATIEFSNQQHWFEFYIKSVTANKADFENLAYVVEDGLSFFGSLGLSGVAGTLDQDA